ncbi:hypothetical protein MHYP_G00356750 [Metynnis hypsauchen]
MDESGLREPAGELNEKHLVMVLARSEKALVKYVNPAAMSWQEDQPPLSLSHVLCSCRMNSAHSIVSPVPGRGGRQASKNAQSTHR